MNLSPLLRELTERGVVPVLHYTPIRPEFADQEDPDDPEPRWCCHDDRDEMFHFHGATPEEAVTDMHRTLDAGHRPRVP